MTHRVHAQSLHHQRRLSRGTTPSRDPARRRQGGRTKVVAGSPATPETATPAPVSDPPVEDVRETAVADPQLNDQIRELLEVILERVEQLEDNRRQSLQEMQTVAVELGVAAAAYILNQQVAADEFRLLPLIEEAVQRLSPYEDITVQLNPEDHQALVRANPEQVSAIEAKATVVTDPRAQRGTVVVKSGDQGWMSSFEERLGAVRENLLNGIDYARIERRQTQTTPGMRRFPERRQTA